MMIIAQFSVRV